MRICQYTLDRANVTVLVPCTRRERHAAPDHGLHRDRGRRYQPGQITNLGTGDSDQTGPSWTNAKSVPLGSPSPLTRSLLDCLWMRTRAAMSVSVTSYGHYHGDGNNGTSGLTVSDDP
jgi:hypothetical protein